MKKRLFTILILSLFFLLGCQNQSTNENNDLFENLNHEIKGTGGQNKQVEYFLDLEHSLSNNTLIVNGKTNLPEGSILSLYVDRRHHNIGDKDVHIGELGSFESKVNNGGFSTQIILNDETWFNRVKGLNELENAKFEWISDKVNLNVIFIPMNKNQPSSVINMIGKKGENLRGNDVKESEILSLKTLKKTVEIDYPISRTLLSTLNYKVENTEQKLEESKSTDPETKNKKVTFSADKYRDGY